MSTFMERFIKKHGKIKIWSPTFKAHVIRVVQSENLTYGEAAERFKISSQQAIKRWMCEYRKQLAAEKSIVTMPQHNSPCVQPDTAATEHILQLQQALRYAEMKNTALNALIELAETTYKIAIRKNSGTGQHDC
jgi:transposase-like protein